MIKLFKRLGAVKLKNFFLLLLMLCLLPLPTVQAHGGGELQIGNAPVGNYLVSIWVNPPTARAGEAIHVTVGIAQASTGEPVLDAAVDVLILDGQGEPVAAAAATTEQSVNRLFYEADLEDVRSGEYEMQITVTGRDGRGDLSFPLAVEPRSVWPWLGGAAAAVVVIGLIVRRWRKRGTVAEPRRRTAVPRARSVD